MAEQRNTVSNPFAVFDEDRPAVRIPQAGMSEHELRAIRSQNRELFLRESGYEIIPEGQSKVLKVNRDWIAKGGGQQAQEGGNNARWLLFIDDRPPLAVYEALFLDETQTETEVVATTQRVKHGCSTIEQKVETRSAYMITTGRVAYKLKG